MNLYFTADRVNSPSGGGAVTYHESQAMASLGGDFRLLDRNELEGLTSRKVGPEPWGWDNRAFFSFGNSVKLAHIYSGTFSECVVKLRTYGAKVTYTAAAHSVELSKREHEALGLPYDYPHLTNPELWRRYLRGYKEADVLICPSNHSKDVMRSFGCRQRIEVIPHGCNLPENIRLLPSRFTVGYLGSFGPDKGVRYLLEAWKKLNYKDATLILAGRDSTSPFAGSLIQSFGGGNIHLMGWVEDVSTFYNSISLYVQPSVTEGFGIEVLEALAHGRPTVASVRAGASDLLPNMASRFVPEDPNEIPSIIDFYKNQGREHLEHRGRTTCLEIAQNYTWDKIREKYTNLWKELS